MVSTVLVTHNIPKRGLAGLSSRHRVLFPQQGVVCFTPEQILALMPSVDAVLACGAITAQQIARAANLKIISNHGAGYERIDVAAATARGIPVTNIPDATAMPTAELAIGLLLSLSRRITELDRRLRTRPAQESFGMGLAMGHSLAGKLLGIVGLGHIGRCMARMARAFGMQVAYYQRHALPGDQAEGAVYMPLEELLAACDVLSIHCPLTEQTAGLIGRRELLRMKPGALLINTSRGGTVDYDALIEALRQGRLGGAGLDVFPGEPEIPGALLQLENAVLTPHIGTNTVEDRDIMAKACADRIEIALSGQRPPNVVNPSIYGLLN